MRFEIDGARTMTTDPVIHQGRSKPKGLDWDALRAKSTPTPIAEPVVATADQEHLMTDTTTVTPATDHPDYIREFADLMRVTEGHPDKLVRDIRKIITQTALTLRTAYNTVEATTPTSTLSSPATLVAVPDTTPTKGETSPVKATMKAKAKAAKPTTKKGKETKPAAKKSTTSTASPDAVARLLADLNATAADVRDWARNDGRTVTSRGRVSLALVEAYAAANPKVA